MIKLKLAQKISVFTVFLIFISVIISVMISGNWYIQKMMISIEENTLNVVKVTAMSPVIVDGLKTQSQNKGIQKVIEETQTSIEGIDVMVVADINGIRYGHTKSDRVGKLFSAEDNFNAIKYGETYVSIGPGTLGESLRAFAPVKDENGTILGFVMAGTLLDSIENAKRDIFYMIAIFVLISGSIGVLGATILSYYIKKSLLNYEPEDIARLYLENQGILSTVREGVIAINELGKITLINETAKKYLHVQECVGINIDEIFPLAKLTNVLTTKKSNLDVQFALKDRIVIANNVPIITDNGKVIGGVCSFRDQTELNNLAEEITGVKKIVDALRATTHEFKNKLHVILGFIETKRLEEAKSYIGGINDELQETISDVISHIDEPTIAALLIGKIQRMHELKIKWILDDDTNFSNKSEFAVNSLVVIIGNILSNAMDNLDSIDKNHKYIQLKLIEVDNQIVISIEDNGTGIKEKKLIFEKGYTSKAKNRGYGLYLVRQQVERYRGSIVIEDIEEGGSRFVIKLYNTKYD